MFISNGTTLSTHLRPTVLKSHFSPKAYSGVIFSFVESEDKDEDLSLGPTMCRSFCTSFFWAGAVTFNFSHCVGTLFGDDAHCCRYLKSIHRNKVKSPCRLFFYVLIIMFMYTDHTEWGSNVRSQKLSSKVRSYLFLIKNCNYFGQCFVLNRLFANSHPNWNTTMTLSFFWLRSALYSLSRSQIARQVWAVS